MIKRALIAAACTGLAACASGAQEPQPQYAAWSYSGANGPQRWGDLSPAYSACASGTQQSPIDLSAAAPAFISGPALNWRAVDGGEVVNTGDTLQVNLNGAGGLTLNGKYYELRQFQFRHRSEHTLNGASFPMEAQFVHAATDGTLAVIGVFIDAGAANSALTPIWTTAPAAPGKAAVSFPIDAGAFLPSDDAAFRYEGSLTTPPCSEIVSWTVAKNPIQASASQIAAFAALFPKNARPVQPLNRRYVLATP